MKKYSLAFLILSVLFISLFSCKKINESTNLGGDLIPGVDNVNTFEVALDAITNNAIWKDTVRIGFSDLLALGDVNDPEFGNTHANMAFSVTPSFPGIYPFINKDSVTVDSVVLSLSFQRAWGDTVGNGIQTLRVYEIAKNSGFKYDTVYKYGDPLTDFAANPGGTTGIELGSKTYKISSIAKDSFLHVMKGDTVKLLNVVRIPLDKSLGTRFTQYDTTSNPVSGAFKNDSTFREFFKGLAIKADNSGNALAYFSLADNANTKLTVYFRAKKNGIIDTTAFDFVHKVNSTFPRMSDGRANYVKHTPGGLWNTHLTNGNPSDSLIFLQGSPSGAYASIVIPGLDTFSNKVIHIAEVIATIPPQYQSSIFSPPVRLFMDRKRDSAFFLFERDIAINSLNGSLSLDNFGGALRTDTYKFNITRYVQNIVTRGEKNDTLRLHAPFRTRLAVNERTNLLPEVGILEKVAGGRVILAGGSFSQPRQRLRLRIIYSNL